MVATTPYVLARYARSIITPPIELLVVTQADVDHWQGLLALLGYPNHSLGVREFWEPGYARHCAPLPRYDTFINWIRAAPGIRFCRPLTACYPRQPQRVTVGPIAITILHTDAQPSATPCPYTINSAAIVLLVEINGTRLLFTGDAPGKSRTARADVTPTFVEGQLLGLEHRAPGTLRADVLKVPHHGSESSSTTDFINAVNPRFVIISASTRHHLPTRPSCADTRRATASCCAPTRTEAATTITSVCIKRRRDDLESNYKDVLTDY